MRKSNLSIHRFFTARGWWTGSQRLVDWKLESTQTGIAERLTTNSWDATSGCSRCLTKFGRGELSLALVPIARKRALALSAKPATVRQAF